jgi:hypothetical protein
MYDFASSIILHIDISLSVGHISSCQVVTHNLYTRLKTTSNYSAIANLHNLQITTAPTKPFPACFVLTSRSLATVLTVEIFQIHALRSHLHGLPCRTQRNSLLQLFWLYLFSTAYIENTVILLFHSYLLLRERIYRAVAQKFPQRGRQKTPLFYYYVRYLAVTA